LEKHSVDSTVQNILILGVNGFIGNALARKILHTYPHWHLEGIDLEDDRILDLVGNSGFSFRKGDVLKDTQWIKEAVERADIVFPLVAIAHPAMYVEDPLRVFSLDFESNLEIVRYCVQGKKWLIFPSTSEVYGMSPDEEVCEESSFFVQGPISKDRWIYSCSKQLLDRVIHAYGWQEGLRYSLFRPFNWIGPQLDRVGDMRARVVTRFLTLLLQGKNLTLVGGGQQRRSFTDIDDGIEGLMAILANPKESVGQIFNLGNPKNDVSIKTMALTLLECVHSHPCCPKSLLKLSVEDIQADDLYGSCYQDVSHRVPSIRKAREQLGWKPQIGLRESLEKIVDHFFNSVPE
jgi:nucleoside-diphosphate-sugar epimerase